MSTNTSNAAVANLRRELESAEERYYAHLVLTEAIDGALSRLADGTSLTARLARAEIDSRVEILEKHEREMRDCRAAYEQHLASHGRSWMVLFEHDSLLSPAQERELYGDGFHTLTALRELLPGEPASDWYRYSIWVQADSEDQAEHMMISHLPGAVIADVSEIGADGKVLR
jgi:hypothetical protein